MKKQFTALQTKEWLERLPKKAIGVKAILLSEDGEVLVLNPVGKSWQLPGGTVEQNESPETSLLRELKEELGLDIPQSSLKQEGVAYRSDYDHVIIFYSSSVPLDKTANFDLQTKEIESFKFVDPSELSNMINAQYKEVIENYIAGLNR